MSGAARAAWPAEFTLGTWRDLRHQVLAVPVSAAVPPATPIRAHRAGPPSVARVSLLPTVSTRAAAITTGVAVGRTCGSAGTADAGVC